MNFEEASIEADFASALHDDELFGALEPPPNNSCRNCWGRPVLPYAAFVLLGVAPQFLQNMLFSEAPLMASILPEGIAIQAHIVAGFMIANVISLLYLVLQLVKSIPDLVSLIVVLVIGVIDAVVIACFWDLTIEVAKQKFSLILMIGAFVAGAAGNTSTLIGFSFAAQYKEIFVSALSAGFGLSGLLPSLLTFAQNTGAEYPSFPNFGPSVWFLSSAFLTIVFSLPLFYIISHSDIKDPEHTRHRFEQKFKLLPGESAINEVDVPAKTSKKVLRVGECLAMMVLASFSTFLIPGSLPYVGESKSDLVWMNMIFLVVPTVGTLAAGWLRPFKRSRIVPWVLIALQSILFVYFLLVTLRHVRPYIYHKLPLVFIALILFAILSGYNSTMVYLLLRQEEVVDISLMEQAQRFAGFAFQLGGFLGVFANLALLHGHLYYKS